MRKWITLLMTLVAGLNLSYANADAGQVTFEAGYRRDNISWSFDFPSSSPILNTHTKLKDIDIFQIGLKGRTTIGCNFYLRANAYWGWVLDGDYRHSVGTQTDFYGFTDITFENEFEFTQENRNVIDDKYVYGVGAAIGYPFYFCDCSLALAPVIGYAFDEQNICVDDHGIDFTDTGGFFFPTSGSECCCHKHVTRWYGPFVGVDILYRPFNCCWNLYAEIEYHWGSFRGRRSHDDFFFFEDRNHSSRHATGWVATFGADYELCNCWTLGFSLKFQDWKATRHHRECGFSDYADYFFYESFCSHRSRANHKWNSWAVNLTLGHVF